MSNVLKFAKKNSKWLIAMEISVLEDSSCWYRIRDIRTNEWLDWVKLNIDETETIQRRFN